MKANTIAVTVALLIAAGANLHAIAGPNDFFNSSIGGSQETQQGSGAVNSNGAAGPSTSMGTPPAGDYSTDEKRMQKKYKENVKVAQNLIRKGEDMMHSKNEKESKKGKIIKEIGEKRLAELKANNPFPELAGREPKKIN